MNKSRQATVGTRMKGMSLSEFPVFTTFSLRQAAGSVTWMAKPSKENVKAFWHEEENRV